MLWFIRADTFSNVYHFHLNTSYVMVHRCRNSKGSFYNKYLNTSYVMVHLIIGAAYRHNYIFKYILCYGSSKICRSYRPSRPYLNTSYVMVHPASRSALFKSSADLNTSYVMVHQEKKSAVWKRRQYLNTSYVMVHHFRNACKETFSLI